MASSSSIQTSSSTLTSLSSDSFKENKSSQVEPLSEEQIRQYFFDGCLLIPNFFSETELQQIQEWTEELESLASSMPSQELYKGTGIMKSLETVGGVQQVCRIENFIPFHSGWSTASHKIAQLIGQLFSDDGKPAHLFKEKINFKRAGGKGYAPHYDGPSPALFGFASNYITAQVAIDDQTPENGCLLGVIPKNQCPDEDEREATLIVHKSDGDPDGDGRAGAIRGEVAEELPWQFLPAPAGSLFVFNHWFPHYSEGNKTEKTRRTAYLLYNSAADGDHHQEYVIKMQSLREKYGPKKVNPTSPSY